MLPFIRNNSLLLLANNIVLPVQQQPSGVALTFLRRDILTKDIDENKIYDSTLSIDALCIPETNNKIYNSTLALDTIAIQSQQNKLYQSSLYIDILCSDTI